MSRPGRQADTSPAVREFGASLRRRRDEERRTQQDIADALGVQRATLSQWETGRHLPSADNAAQLDTLLSAGGELIALRDAAGDDPVDASRMSLRGIQTRAGRVLVDELKRDADTGRLGWSHDLDDDLRPTPLSSAFAAKTLALVEAPYVDLAAIAEGLVNSREQRYGGGWGARRMRPRPECSAVVVDALTRIGGRVDVDAELKAIEHLIDESRQSSPRPSATSSTYVLSTVLEVVARLRPRSPFADRLTEMLVGLQREHGWPEKEKRSSGPSSPRPALSTAHTARAVIALAVVRDTGPDEERESGLRDRAGTAVRHGIDWLLRNAQDHPIRENLYSIDREGQIGDLEIRHMTPALIARALALADEPDVTRIQRALDGLWMHYDPAQGLWTWPNGDLPLWLQYEAVAATRVAYGRITAVTVPTRQES